MFNQLVASSGPPPKSIYDSINAAPIQKGSPLSIPPVSWTFSYPGYLPSGPGIENNADYWPPLQSVPPWAQTWGLIADEIGHYQGQFGALSQAQFNQIIASSGPPPEGALDTINSNPAQASTPLGILRAPTVSTILAIRRRVVFCAAHRSGRPMVNGQSKT
jgi:hypothetical protein